MGLELETAGQTEGLVEQKVGRTVAGKAQEKSWAQGPLGHRGDRQ